MNPPEAAKIFAIDYDATWSADPEAFRAISRLLRSRGHRVLLITARVSGHGEVQRECSDHVDRVMFSGAEYKRDHATALGESVDIWIDDNPCMIGPDVPIADPWRDQVTAAAKSPDKGVSSFFGTWPGDETDAEFLDALRDARGKSVDVAADWARHRDEVLATAQAKANQTGEPVNAILELIVDGKIVTRMGIGFVYPAVPS